MKRTNTFAVRPLTARRGGCHYTTLHLSADASATHLTFLSMLVATNDGIVGLDTMELPERVNESRTYYANGYDVGTEQNTERFADLVPPAKTLILAGEPEGTGESNEAIAEDGVIRPHPGIEGVGNLPRRSTTGGNRPQSYRSNVSQNSSGSSRRRCRAPAKFRSSRRTPQARQRSRWTSTTRN